MEQELTITLDHGHLGATLALPPSPRGIVIFAHGSGSSRFSPRNRYVAEKLQAAGLATLLIDLLTAEEDITEETDLRRFDIGLLAGRLLKATEWAEEYIHTSHLPVGYFGASTGAGAALAAAAHLGDRVKAVVSRGGRPDLAGDALPRVPCPVLLIVGEFDDVVIDLNRDALAQLRTLKSLEIVPRATHLFEEPGALDKVAQLAAGWFYTYLNPERLARAAA